MHKALLLIALFFTNSALAAGEDPAKTSAYACAKSLQLKTGIGAFKVVRMTQRSGSGNFRIWLNDHNKQIGGYCETLHEQVTRTFTKPSPWHATHMYKPASEDLAAL